MGIAIDQIDAVVLAGGVNRIALYEGYQPGYKALLEFNGIPSVQYTLEALVGLPKLGRICIVGPERELRDVCTALPGASSLEYTAGADSFIGSIINGLDYFKDSQWVLVATADIPLVTPMALTDFIAACAEQKLAYEENMFLSVVPERSFTGEYAGSVKGFNRFRDVTICHGNAMLINPRILANAKARHKLDALYNARKNPLQAALAIGLRLGVAYIVGVHWLHALKLRRMAWLASLRFHFGIIPVMVEHPGLAIDIDEPADYSFVSDMLSRRQGDD